ncbi:hypothetical protein [Flavobacterium sp. ACAM 123]|uniref:hypothetical protein n=1 Tax=Flavobacterium sp. ACAM 123 TaxID=1189620 RepID=UPI0002F0CA89|nr:hypothetical protein [Flavobacterium sp. ACAM 123]
MDVNDLIGSFTIVGSNQDAEENNYKGTLTLAVDTNSRVTAKWLINNEQEQIGTGFFRDAILVINFNYKGDNDEIFKGVVVYRCLSKDLLDGFWSEKQGNPLYLGTERCFRSTKILN